MKIPFLNIKLGPKIPEKIYEEEILTIADIIAPASIEVSPNYLRIGEKFARSYFVFSYPRYLSTAWLSPVINLNFTMDISFFLHPMESEKV